MSVSVRDRSGESTARSRAKVVAVVPSPADDEELAPVAAVHAANDAEPPPLDLKTLKTKSIADLATLARERQIDGAATLRKQDLIFAILQAQADRNGQVHGEGVLTVGDTVAAKDAVGVETDGVDALGDEGAAGGVDQPPATVA